MLKTLYHGLKHRRRYLEITFILARYGWGYLRRRQGRYSFQGAGRQENQMKLCRLFEELGPTFIKLGQLLSTRPDLVGLETAGELAGLQDQVQGFGLGEVRKEISRGLGRPPEALFAFFEEQPLASASIGQVHRAILPGGREAAVKIRRPGLERRVAEDLLILQDLLKILQRGPLTQLIDVSEVVRIFGRQITRELDFNREAQNLETFQKIFAEEPQIRIPQVYREYSSSGILTMEYIAGYRIEEAERLFPDPQSRRRLAENILRAVMLPFFRTGTFYADPHPGNVLFLPDGTIALVDFGIVARLDEDFRFQAASLLLAVARSDVSRIMEIALNFAPPDLKVKREELYEDIGALVEEARANQGQNTYLTSIIRGMLKISWEHGLPLPGTFFSLGRALIEAESLARRLDPDCDLVGVLEPLALQFISRRFGPETEPRAIYGRMIDLAETIWQIPADAVQVLHNLAEGEMRAVFVHRGLDELYRLMDVVSTRLAVGLISGAMMGASALVLLGPGRNLNLVAYVALGGLGLSFFLSLWMIWGMLRHGRLG